MPDEREPRPNTLSILARFIGYSSMEKFINNRALLQNGQEPSSPFLGRHLSVIDGLTRGDCLRLTWHPGRVCDVEYNGSQHFSVIASENTKLKPNDTFLCAIIIEGQPLYQDQLQQGDKPPSTYICGKIGGVRFELLKK